MFPVMLTALAPIMAQLPILAQAGGLTWTPETFYVAAGIVQVIVILLGFRFLHLDAEHNTFIGAIFVAILTNVAAYFLKDFGVLGVIGTASTLMLLLIAISHADVIKSGIVWLVAMAVYGALALAIIPRADGLYLEQVAGVPQVIVGGGLVAEPVTEDTVKNLTAPPPKR